MLAPEQGCSPRGCSLLVKIFGGSAPLKCQSIEHFLKLFHSAVDLQTYFNICSQYQGRTNGELHPGKKFCCQINQILNFCWKIVSVKTFCREIKPLVSEYCDTSGRVVTSRCNDAVGNINSTEVCHMLALRFSHL